MKIGRNEPCFCGSGKKYKKCCLAADEERARQQRAEEQAQHAHVPGQRPVCDCCGERMEGYGYVDMIEADELDELSNRFYDLIEAGKLDQAEALGQELLARFPDQIDGLEGLAEVFRARGEADKAIEYYRKAAAFATIHQGFDREVVTRFTREARLLEEKVR